MDSHSETEAENEEYDDFRKELADIPLGEIQKLKETIGLKKYNEALFGTCKQKTNTNNIKKEEDTQENTVNKTKKKSSDIEQKKKSEPIEISSKHQDFKARKVVDVHNRKIRDPRFDALSGNYNEEMFEKSYDFINDIKRQELEAVKKQLKKVKNREKKEQLKSLLRKMRQETKLKESKKKMKELERNRKEEEKTLIEKGKKPFYLKKSDRKKQELVERYKELKSGGKLDKYLSKKRKRNAMKEKKKLPRVKIN